MEHPSEFSKELFERAQEQIRDHYIPKTESKEFAFTKLIACGYCESGITADEKFKKLSKGGTSRYVYYHCTKGKGVDCANPPINEAALIEELLKQLDTINIDELGMRSKIEEEVARYNKFRVGVLGVKRKDSGQEIDARTYAKYLLRDGTITEKRELLGCLRSRLILKDRRVTIN